MAHRTKNALDRVEILLRQAEQFEQKAGVEEAFARARQVIAYGQLEMQRESDPAIRDQLAQLCLLAERLVMRLGKSVRDRRGRLVIGAADALTPESWD
jgi:hypothetical protein